jgi:YD repeat-containing protein
LSCCIQQKNIDLLDGILSDIIDSGYKKAWLTHSQVTELTYNEDGQLKVIEWLQSNNVEITWKSAHYLKASTTISIWNKLLNTIFYEWKDNFNNNILISFE